METGRQLPHVARWLCCVTFVAFVGASLCMGQDAKPGLKIGVVNLTEVFDKYKKREDLEGRLKGERKKKLDIMREKRKEIDKLQEEVQLYDLGAEARRKAEEELDKKKVEYEGYRKLAEDGWLKQYMESTQQLYVEIRDELDKLGREEKFDLILKVEDRDVRSETINILQLKIELRTLLYHDDKLNVTAKMIKRLNDKYAKDIEEK
ncbi:MAG: OmpH family outer membrane protein [Planctomycetes bacterium]|nr:OmpH family outer membrane protein [Planctomycetota bacterium]